MNKKFFYINSYSFYHPSRLFKMALVERITLILHIGHFHPPLWAQHDDTWDKCGRDQAKFECIPGRKCGHIPAVKIRECQSTFFCQLL
jgi:hypothetical protein